MQNRAAKSRHGSESSSVESIQRLRDRAESDACGLRALAAVAWRDRCASAPALAAPRRRPCRCRSPRRRRATASAQPQPSAPSRGSDRRAGGDLDDAAGPGDSRSAPQRAGQYLRQPSTPTRRRRPPGSAPICRRCRRWSEISSRSARTAASTKGDFYIQKPGKVRFEYDDAEPDRDHRRRHRRWRCATASSRPRTSIRCRRRRCASCCRTASIC